METGREPIYSHFIEYLIHGARPITETIPEVKDEFPEVTKALIRFYQKSKYRSPLIPPPLSRVEINDFRKAAIRCMREYREIRKLLSNQVHCPAEFAELAVEALCAQVDRIHKENWIAVTPRWLNEEFFRKHVPVYLLDQGMIVDNESLMKFLERK